LGSGGKRSGPAGTAQLSEGAYRLQGVALATRERDQNSESAQAKFGGLSFLLGKRLPDSRLDQKAYSWWSIDQFTADATSAHLSALPSFEAKPGERNEWPVTIPEDLLQGARDALGM
jgi:hypothetical protein